jgi:DNA-binding transcriptional LysR family regulator
MSLVQVESFVAVAETKHLGRAAKRLCVTQPPLTRRIRDLEEELGTALFVRTCTGLELSPAGEDFLPRALSILDLVAATRSSMRRWKKSDAAWQERRRRPGT